MKAKNELDAGRFDRQAREFQDHEDRRIDTEKGQDARRIVASDKEAGRELISRKNSLEKIFVNLAP